jgi:murein DD-endopeptidase MepM/ murein hydrolase activator NlpD
VNLRAAALALVACASPALADRLALQGELIQGGLVRGATEPGASVALDERAIRVSPDGAFVLGFGRDAKQATLRVRFPDGTIVDRPLTIAQRSYQVQRIDGLPQRQVTPPEEDLALIRDERAAVAAARATDSASAAWRKAFIWPASGPISGVYGSQRILNGEPRRPHLGVDIAAPAGTAVIAPSDAKVVLARPGLYFNGAMVILDHGHGVTSSYSHLSTIAVREGDAVRQGQQIGAIGATGRVTGAHLHWGISVFDVALDPALLVPSPIPASADAPTATVPAAPGSSPPASR